jgi:hypothetical protein
MSQVSSLAKLIKYEFDNRRDTVSHLPARQGFSALSEGAVFVIRVNVAAVGSVWPGGRAIGEVGVGTDDHLGVAVACQPPEAKQTT